MSEHGKTRRALTGLMSLLLLIATSGIAQGPAEEGKHSPNALNDSVAIIQSEIAEYLRLESELADIEPGLRAMMRSRLDAREKEIVEQVDALALELLKRETQGDSQDEYKSQVVFWLQELVEHTKAFIGRNRLVIVEQLAEQSHADPPTAAEAAIRLDRAMSRTSTANRNLYRLLQRLDEFGVDVSEERAQLTMRVREAAEMLAVAIHLDAEELAKLRALLSVTPEDADLQTLIRIADLRRESYAANLNSTSLLLRDLGVESSEYRRLVLVVTGDVASQILDTGVMSGLAREWGVTALAWINDNGLGWVIKLIVFILILMAFRTLSKLSRRWAEQGLQKVNLSVLLRHMIVSTAANLVMFLGILIALSQLGISLGPLLAGLGVIGFIIGFALQDTLGNFASGLMILLYRPYDVGDVIDAGGVSGKVEDMTLVYTTIHTFDNQKMVVPNSKIWGDVIKNVTSQSVRRVDLVFSISYGDDIEKTERVLKEVVENHPLALDEPEPTIKVHTLGDSSVDLIVRPWVKSEDYWNVYWDLTRDVKLRFDQEGISIPFPQRDVHIVSESPPA